MNETINQSLINNSIKSSVPNMDIQVQTFPTTVDLMSYKDSLINGINQFIFAFSQDYAVHIVFLISAVIGLMIMRKNEEEWLYFFIWTLIIFFALRFIGIGG